ncbi:MAG: hypothetical protein E7C44_04545 [Paeniclostridium sordellii]|nr:hypothetical protein [Paeniclostridium sordellii]
MKIYMTYKEDTKEFNGFYQQNKDDDIIPKPNICISSELRWYLQQITNDFKIKDSIDPKEIYTIEDKDIFEIIPFDYEKPKPSRTDLLEQQNAFLIKESLEKDIQVKGIEKDVANLILKSLGGNLNG